MPESGVNSVPDWSFSIRANISTGNRSKNEYGYQYHFDIMAQNEVFGDNPVVDFESVPCPKAAAADFAQCQCAPTTTSAIKVKSTAHPVGHQ